MNDATYLAMQEESCAEARTLLLSGQVTNLEDAMNRADAAMHEALNDASTTWFGEETGWGTSVALPL